MPLVFNLAARAVPWVLGYFIVDRASDVIDGGGRGNNNQGYSTVDYKKSDLERYFQTGEIALRPPSFSTLIPSAQNTSKTAYSEGFLDFDLSLSNLLKFAAIAGAAYVGFKALQEGKKLF